MDGRTSATRWPLVPLSMSMPRSVARRTAIAFEHPLHDVVAVEHEV